MDNLEHLFLPSADKKEKGIILDLLTQVIQDLGEENKDYLLKAFETACGMLSPGSMALSLNRLKNNLGVSRILVKEIGLGHSSVAAVLIFDAFFCGQAGRTEIVSSFGKSVGAILGGWKAVAAVQGIGTSYHSENYIRLLLGLAKDIQVLLIQLARILYSMRNIEALPKTMQKKTAGDAYYLYAPIAHRLGLYNIKTELEDLSMLALFRDDYLFISGRLKETTGSRNEYIRGFIEPLKKDLEKQELRFEIKGRPKSVHSIWKKMKKQQVPFEEVYDLLAIRILLDSPPENEKADCWKVYSIVTNIYPPNPGRLRDWISAPKNSGYEALHTTVQGPQGKWVEVQIRTRRMDDIAEKGHAAHWKYKENLHTTESDGWLRSLRETLENPAIQTLDEERSSLIGLEDPHIFVFTPQGDLKRLEVGSTVLDFAFNVHSDLGLHCTGADVNGKIVPIKHVLSNGDSISIHTSKNQKPKQDWLQFVVSSRTRQRIKKALRDEELKEAEAGRELLLRKLKNWKIGHDETIIDKLVKTLKYKTHLELFQDLATGKRDVLTIKEVLLKPGKEEPAGALPVEVPEKQRKTGPYSGDVIFLDKNLVNINYTLASCCNPVYGDAVFGFVTISRGLSVHRVHCPNAKEMLRRYQYRVVPVKWRKTTADQAFQSTIKIQGIDEMGVLNSVTDLVTNQLNMNIRSISMDTHKGVYTGTLVVFVKDITQLEVLLHKLTKIKGIMKVSRVEK